MAKENAQSNSRGLMQQVTQAQRAGAQALAILALVAAVVIIVTMAGVTARRYKLEQLHEFAALQA